MTLALFLLDPSSSNQWWVFSFALYTYALEGEGVKA